MPTSTRFAVAVHVLAAIAVNAPRTMTSEQLAGSARTNPAVIRKLLGTLARAGISCAKLGQGGGALLARPPEAITLKDVYRAVEGPGLFRTHRSPPDPDCWVGAAIGGVIAQATDEAERALEASLERVTLADVAAALRTGADERHSPDRAIA